MNRPLGFGDIGWQIDAVKAFRRSLSDELPNGEGGKNCKTFGQGLQGVDLSNLPDRSVSRQEVFDLAGNAAANTTTVCAAAMAWGGMNMGFSKPFFALAGEGWLAVADRIRNEGMDRKAAYEALNQLRHDGKLKGAGPAFFTKLIYFLTPQDQAGKAQPYIMDQWAGCSLNVLVGKELVKMNVSRSWAIGKGAPEASFHVSDVNDGADYEAFCDHMEALRKNLKLSVADFDRAIVAQGGRNKSSWRQYVIENRRV